MTLDLLVYTKCVSFTLRWVYNLKLYFMLDVQQKLYFRVGVQPEVVLYVGCTT
jgi:hypothetical protein